MISIGDMSTRSYTSPVRTRHAEDTRRAILEAARTLFTEHGYSQTSVAAVANTAGVALNTVYTSVGGKPALILALVEESLDDELFQETLDRVAITTEPVKILQLVAQRTGEARRRHSATIPLLLDNRTAHPAVAAAAQEGARRYRAQLGQVASRLTELGGLHPGLTRARVEQVLWFYFGPQAWASARELGWGWKFASNWLADQAGTALLAPA